MLSTSLFLFASIALHGGGTSNGFHGLSVQQVLVHPDGSSLAGHETIRVYANLDPGGRIDAVFGNNQAELILFVDEGFAPAGPFYQHPQGGPTSRQIFSPLFPILPDLEWDSYVSIGSIDSNDNNLGDIGIDWTGFETGAAVITNNGAWFVTPDDSQGVAINGRVFLGQFTIPVGSNFVARMNLQGRNSSGEPWTFIGADVVYGQYSGPGFPPSVYCLAISNSFCPCGNVSVFGDWGGCRNSTGVSGKLLASGSPSLSNDTLVLEAFDLVPNLPCLFFSGANRVNGGAGLPFGDGLRCAGFEAVRIQVTGANAAGVAATSVEVSTNGQAYGHTIEVGETVHYQCWYRDDVSVSLCGNSFNTTNGYSLTWNR